MEMSDRLHQDAEEQTMRMVVTAETLEILRLDITTHLMLLLSSNAFTEIEERENPS